MIETTSWPADLTDWAPAENPFYLELFGETSPVLDTALAEVLPAGAADPRTCTSRSAAAGGSGRSEIGSVPQSKEFPWSVEKVTFGGNGHDVMQGVAWNLPASLLRAQGGRLTGSLAVSVMPVSRQQAGAGTAVAPAVARLPAKAHAGVFLQEGDAIWLPGPDARGFVELQIEPVMPAA